MCFPRTRGAHKYYVFSSLDKYTGCQFFDLSGIYGWLEGKIKGLQGLYIWQSSHGCVHGNLFFMLLGGLFCEQLIQEISVAHIVLTGFLQQDLQSLAGFMAS